MTDFPFDSDTRLIRIFEAYPWLSELLPRLDKRFAVMNSAIGRILMEKNSVKDLSRIAGLSPEKLLDWLRCEIEKHASDER